MVRKDAMQVCRNGHYITDRYHSYPEYRENYCSDCGAETIKECQQCEEEIPGVDLDSNVFVVSSSPPAPPDFCDNCGSPFPWKSLPMEDYDIEEAVSEGESESVEFKRDLPSNLRDISKEVVALANLKGGLLLIGVGDSGNVDGLEDIDEVEERVTGSINSSIDPNIGISVEKARLSGEDILAIHIPKAVDKPYNLNGVFYTRVGTSVKSMDSKALSRWYG